MLESIPEFKEPLDQPEDLSDFGRRTVSITYRDRETLQRWRYEFSLDIVADEDAPDGFGYSNRREVNEPY